MRRVRSYHRSLLAVALGLAAQAGAGAAQAACSGLSQVTVSLSPGPVVAVYDPFAAGDTIRSMTLTVNNPANAQCDVAVAFARAAGAAASMSSGANVLSYDLTRSGGGTSLITTAGYTGVGTPPAANRIDFLNIPARGSASAPVELRLPAGQVVAADSYSDNGLVLQTIRLRNGDNEPNLLGPTYPVTPQASVLSKCVMPPPTLANLDLSAAIANGRPNEGVTRLTSIANVQCTAPTKLRLTGAALQPVQSTPARAGFDNFINYRAQGNFGSASSVLSTTVASQSVDSVQKNVASGVTTSGQIDIQVNLLNGQPIIAGAYSGILTVSIDPSF